MHLDRIGQRTVILMIVLLIAGSIAACARMCAGL